MKFAPEKLLIFGLLILCLGLLVYLRFAPDVETGRSTSATFFPELYDGLPYENEELGFSFSYPLGWILEEESHSDTFSVKISAPESDVVFWASVMDLPLAALNNFDLWMPEEYPDAQLEFMNFSGLPAYQVTPKVFDENEAPFSLYVIQDLEREKLVILRLEGAAGLAQQQDLYLIPNTFQRL